jgi:hypothetical protein
MTFVQPTTATHSRRGLLKTAAWSVPAVTVASAAPAFAASDPVTFAVPQFTGSRAITGVDVVRVNLLQIRNTSAVPLRAGELVISIDMPEHWGNAVAWDQATAAMSEPSADWDITYGANTITFAAKAGKFPIAADTTAVLLSTDVDWAWTVTGDNGSTVGSISVFVSTRSQAHTVFTHTDLIGANTWS